jgi:uncharacterized protein YsxB (DUF464 family)
MMRHSQTVTAQLFQGGNGMIHVTYYRQFNRVTVEGHAGSGPEGHDLVCASVSALALTLAGNVSYMESQGAVYGVTIKLMEGNAEIQCTPYRRYKDSAGQIFRAICVGFELLATQYPKNISYEVRG